jgi:hypothetical protein
VRIGLADTDGSLGGLAHHFRLLGHDVVHGRAGVTFGGARVVIATNDAASPTISGNARTIGGNYAIGRLEEKPERARVFLELPEATEADQETGIAVTVGGWFDAKLGRFLRPLWSALTRRRLGAGDVGPEVGPMISFMWAWQSDNPRVFQRTLSGMESRLRGFGYRGPFTADFTMGRPTKFIGAGCRASWEPLFMGIEDVERLVREPRDEFLPRDYQAGGLWFYALDDGVRVETDLEDPRLLPQHLRGTRTTKRGHALAAFTMNTETIPEARTQLYDECVTKVEGNLLYRNDACGPETEAEYDTLVHGSSTRANVTVMTVEEIPLALEPPLSERRSTRRTATAPPPRTS